jgi:hypothetical protein
MMMRGATGTAGGIGSVVIPSCCLFIEFKGVCWVDLGEGIGYEDFYTYRSIISVFYTDVSPRGQNDFLS